MATARTMNTVVVLPVGSTEQHGHQTVAARPALNRPRR